jgi:hypothetical protein
VDPAVTAILASSFLGNWRAALGHVATEKDRLERERTRRHRRRLVGGIIVGTLLVATFIAGILALQTDTPDRSIHPGLEAPGVVAYDIAGDDAPEFVKIDGQVFPVTSPSKESWWIPFLPFLGVVLAALLTAGASIWNDRKGVERADRLSDLEAIVKARATAQPAPVTSGTDKQAPDLDDVLGVVAQAEEPVPTPSAHPSAQAHPPGSSGSGG